MSEQAQDWEWLWERGKPAWGVPGEIRTEVFPVPSMAGRDVGRETWQPLPAAVP